MPFLLSSATSSRRFIACSKNNATNDGEFRQRKGTLLKRRRDWRGR
jgi:hypothetical protein